MSPEETRCWAYDPDLELTEQDEDAFILFNCDWLTLVHCASDPLCPKADFIEYTLSSAIIRMVRSRRGADDISAIKIAMDSISSNRLSALREALNLYSLWQDPHPLRMDECDVLAKKLLMASDHPLTKFNRTGHAFEGFIEYSMHNSSSGLVFLYIDPHTSNWLYGGRSRYPEITQAQN